MGKLVLVLGGARSGKSRFAERLAARHDRVIYLATGQATDPEMEARIARHKADRPAHWRTLEEGYSPAAALLASGVVSPAADVPPGDSGPRSAVPATILLDCISFLVSNHLLRDEEGCEASVFREIDALLALDVNLVAVSNEVGMGVVPEHRLGRLFRDILGRVNQHLAARADEVYVCWAGLPVEIKRLATGAGAEAHG